MAHKGKEVVTKPPPGKRKKDNAGKCGGRKRRNPGVLQFFEVAADVHGEDEESDEDEVDQDFVDEVTAELKNKDGPVKGYELPILPKEEELSDNELERYLEERYKTGSHHVVYAGDECETKESAGDPLMHSTNDPTIWRIKCMVGRERQIVFSLIQKYVDLRSLGTKLKMISAFTLEHIKGYIYVEAERQSDVLEACKGLCNLYFSRISPIPNNEVSHLFSVRNTTCDVSMGTWARVKYGKYKGDLAQVVAVDDARKRAIVKLIPRIDLQALSKKLAGGGTVKETTVPAPRMISSSELEDFRPHIKMKRDQLTGNVFETIDGLMLKDGHLYKKVSVESLRYSGVVPSADELQKFETYNKDESDDIDWLLQLFGEKRKKRTTECNKGTTKGEGTSGTKKRLSKCGKGMTKGFEDTSGTKKGGDFQLHDLVFFGQNDFGVIIGMENDNYQILKGGSEGAEVVNVDLHEIKSGSLDKKFTTLDKHMLKLSLNDTVRVLEGPFEGKQGVVKHICKETIFIYDQNQLENSGYFCVKSQLCENVSHPEDAHCENDGDRAAVPIFEDSTVTPNSPELPNKKRWTKDDFNSNRGGDKDGAFSIGQTLRIRVGPLKGHICRVIALYRSDVTVKLDSQMKVITVKCEHLSEAGVKSIRAHDSNFVGSFDGFGTQGPLGDAMEVSGATTNNSGWNSAALTTRRNGWPSFSASEFLLDSTSENPFGSLSTSNDQEKDKGDDPWGSKTTSKKVTDGWGKAVSIGGDHSSSWRQNMSEEKTVENKQDQADGWDKSLTSWDRATGSKGFGGSVSNQWGAGKNLSGDKTGSNDAGGSWDTGKLKIGNSADCPNMATSTWGKTDNTVSECNGNTSSKNQWTWDKGKGVVGDETGAWDNVIGTQDKGNCIKSIKEGSWSKAKDVSTEIKQDSWEGASATRGKQKWGDSVVGWTQSEAAQKDQASGWNKAECLDGGHSGSWCNGEDTTDGGTKGWRKDNNSWSKPKVLDTDRESSWSKGADKSIKEDSWGKAVESLKARDVLTESKQDRWNRAATVRGHKTWGNSVGSWTQPESAQSDQASGWNKTEVNGSRSGNWVEAETSDGGAKNWKKSGDDWSKPKALGSSEASSWSKGTAAGAGDGWNKPKGDDGDQEFGWSKGMMDRGEPYGNNDQPGREDRPRTFDGERGSGGRRGRGGSRGGDRNHFNRGRSFGRGQSSGWNRENHANSWTGGESSGNTISGWSDGQSDGWNKAKTFGGDHQSNWDSATQNAGGDTNQDGGTSKFSAGENGKRNDNWNNASSFNAGGNLGVGWRNAEKESGGNQMSGWGNKASNAKGDQSSDLDGKASNWNDSKGDQSSGLDSKASSWNNSIGDLSSNWDSKASSWNNSKASQSSGWNSKPSNWSNLKSNESSGLDRGFSANGDRGNGWNRTNTSNQDQIAGCNSNWSTRKDSCGTQSSAWSQKLAANEEDGIKSQEDGWNRKKASDDGWVTGSKSGEHEKGASVGGGSWSNSGYALGGDQSSGWGKRANETGSEGQSDIWSRKTFGSNGNSSNWKGGNSNGGNWRGGKSFGQDQSSGWSRGSSDNGTGDQAGSSYGTRDFGCGQLSGSNRGGFGNSRGRGRRGGRTGGWNRGHTYGSKTDGAGDLNSDHMESWNQGGFSKGGWQKESSGHKESWNHGGFSKGQWQRESGPSKDGSGGDGNQAGGWIGQGSGWNGTSSHKETGGWNSVAGLGKGDGKNGWTGGQGSGWSRRKDSNNEARPKDQGSNWSQSQPSGGSQWASWKKGADSTADAGGTGGGWNKGACSVQEGDAPTNDQDSWNNQASGKRGTHVSKEDWNAGKTDAWNRPSAPGAAQSSSEWNKSAVANENWNQSNAPDAAQSSSGWNKPTDAKEAANEKEHPTTADPWGKATSGSRGKGDGWK